MLRFLILLALLCGAAAAQEATPPAQAYHFDLTEAEADLIVRSLAEQPFRTVAPLIQKIQRQFAAQRAQPVQQPRSGAATNDSSGH